MTDPDADLVRRLHNLGWPTAHEAADRIVALGKALTAASEIAGEAWAIEHTLVLRADALLADCENPSLVVSLFPALLARIKAREGNSEPGACHGGPSGPSEGDRKEPSPPGSGDLLQSTKGGDGNRRPATGATAPDNTQPRQPEPSATAGGADPKPVAWRGLTPRGYVLGHHKYRDGDDALVTLDAALAAVQAERAACLREFDVPVEYRPTGWREKYPALRQRSLAEVREAIAARSTPEAT